MIKRNKQTFTFHNNRILKFRGKRRDDISLVLRFKYEFSYSILKLSSSLSTMMICSFKKNYTNPFFIT